MSLGDVTESWAAYYEELGDAEWKGEVDAATKWILKRAPWTHNMARRQLFASLGIGAGTSLLQAGSGIGKSGISEALLAGCRVTLLDYSGIVLEKAKLVIKNLVSQDPEIENRIRMVKGDLGTCPLKECVDVTFNEGVIEHWFEDQERIAILRQMARATKPGGMVIVFVPNERNRFYRSWIAKFGEKSSVPPERGFSSSELREKMQMAGLADVQVKGFAPHLTLVVYNILPCFLRFLALLIWVGQRFIPEWLFNSYSDRYGMWLVGIGVKHEDVDGSHK